MPNDTVRDEDLRMLVAQLIVARPSRAKDVEGTVALADRYAEEMARLRRERARGGKGGRNG